MLIQDAIKEAGPCGKGKCGRYSFTRCERESNVKFHINDELVWNLPIAIHLSDQWEVIPEERIELNDVVKEAGCQAECTITAIGLDLHGNKSMTLQRIGITCACSHERQYDGDLTLIRKGPAKHVFEGTQIKSNNHDTIVFPVMEKADDYRVLANNYKKYRMTLEEME